VKKRSWIFDLKGVKQVLNHYTSLPFIPDDLSPNNVAHFVERLNNLQAFQ